jgi:hypothetical protein
MADKLAEDLQALSHGGSTITPRCRLRVGTVKSFLNINICICLDAKTSCKNIEGMLVTNQTTVIVDITITINWSGRQNMHQQA